MEVNLESQRMNPTIQEDSVNQSIETNITATDATTPATSFGHPGPQGPGSEANMDTFLTRRAFRRRVFAAASIPTPPSFYKTSKLRNPRNPHEVPPSPRGLTQALEDNPEATFEGLGADTLKAVMSAVMSSTNGVLRLWTEKLGAPTGTRRAPPPAHPRRQQQPCVSAPARAGGTFELCEALQQPGQVFAARMARVVVMLGLTVGVLRVRKARLLASLYVWDGVVEEEVEEVRCREVETRGLLRASLMYGR
ncbi:uncharacterized protein GGS25DRAFT_532582 [Hypoxylon fragiforme]|uniref:uncharacterized protein n=1 Tax=Hypoxylon fragiforme TaxID=63214 RepID=UPI0020C5EF8C|nr:uncharacterized protein GGS25DRAFT_532582 [Hypoxylon fragiforme]KAI2607434.1 hypothetical protein GGS25DRAFT_532582 [Hypoxylon fragiforme]